MKIFVLSLLGALVSIPLFAAEELEIAKDALRDGLWDIAASHAENVAGDEARVVILEAYSRERRWDDIIGAALEWKASGALDSTPSEDEKEFREAIRYYEALAFAEKGESEKSKALLESAAFETEQFESLSKTLRARLLAESGETVKALELVEGAKVEGLTVSEKMSHADLLHTSGDVEGAKKIWREVISNTNEISRAFVICAANLEEREMLRLAAEQAKGTMTRRFASLRLARLLIRDAATFDEGAKIIKTQIRESPDTEGAMEAAADLADAYLERESWQESADSFRNVLEIWPQAAEKASIQESIGWAARKLGRHEEALEAFSRAEELAGDDETKAMLVLDEGEELSDLGKGDEAMSKYRQVLEKYPDTKAAAKIKEVIKKRDLETKGRELYREYRFQEAQDTFAELARIAPELAARAEFLQVLCLYGLGQDVEAEKRAKAIAESSSDDNIKAEATLWLAKLAYNDQRLEESAKLFAAFADMAPSSGRSPGALMWAARAYFARSDYPQAILAVTTLKERYPESSEISHALVVQGEALMELGRYDEVSLVFENALQTGGLTADERLTVEVLRADAQFSMGADNPNRYRAALEAYLAIRQGEELTPGMKLALSFKIGRTLEKLNRINEAIDQYYTGVVLAYREGRQKGEPFDDEARSAFAKAAFKLADVYESGGQDFQAMHILELVIASDVPASSEAEKRLDRIQTKGKLL